MPADAIRPLVAALQGLVDATVDRLLASEARVTSAAQGRQLIARDDETEELADRLQRVAVLAVPLARTLVRGARFSRVPWVLVASTVASTTVTLRTGLRELRVLASLVAHRLEQEGGPADRALVEKVALELYLSPGRQPRIEGGLPLLRVLRRWLVGGVLGRDGRKRAGKALDAAERLDAADVLARWHAAGHR